MSTQLEQEGTARKKRTDDAVDVIGHLDNSNGSQFLAFQLANQDFGVDILCVQEIRNYSSITPIPNTPPHVKGAMNLRGTVVPIIDLRVQFGMPEAKHNKHTVIIVVNVGSRILGLIVDAVSDVLNVSENELEPSPDFGHDVDTTFISGLANSGDQLTTLLDLEKLIGHEQLDQVAR